MVCDSRNHPRFSESAASASYYRTPPERLQAVSVESPATKYPECIVHIASLAAGEFPEGEVVEVQLVADAAVRQVGVERGGLDAGVRAPVRRAAPPPARPARRGLVERRRGRRPAGPLP